MVSQCTKYKVSRFTRYVAMNGGAKCRKWGGLGQLEVTQGHVSNFYIVDLENFATASRRNTGDIHNTSFCFSDDNIIATTLPIFINFCAFYPRPCNRVNWPWLGPSLAA